MDGLETPYEIEVPIDFIDCSSCNKSIRSETLYKVHLTTIGHMKKEEALAANGQDIRSHMVPDFKDIMQYLQYLNLDEPIIGLGHLEEVIGTDANDPQPGPRYACRLCSLEANLPNMINHIIGRKHRQKYLMTQRKDLVTWDNSTIFNQPAKVIRAKSEVVERQDGRGTPKPMKRNEGKSNITRVPQKNRTKQHKRVPQNTGPRGAPPHPWPVHHPGHYYHHEGHPPPFHPGDHYCPEEEGREHYQMTWHMPPHSPQQEGYMDIDHGRQEFMEPDYHRGSPEGPRESGYKDYPFPWPEGHPMHGFEEEMPHREEYEQEASPYRRLHPEKDPLERFYSEELWRERARKAAATAAATVGRNYSSREPQETFPADDDDRIWYAYSPEGAEQHHPGGHPRGPRYPPEAPDRGSIDYPYESDRFDDEIRQRAPAPEESYPGEDGHRAGYPEAQRRAYADGHAPHPGYPDQDRLCSPEPRRNTDQPLDRDYLFEMVGALHNKTAGPPREAADPSYQMMPEGGRGMSEIPEPFRRFLQRKASSRDVRKRKSRFSDATQEEIEGSKRMLMELDGFSMFEESGPSRQSRERHEAHGSQRLNPCTKSQSQYQPEDYPEEGFENAKDGGKVFDLLKNIEIENGEEADFLKSKLCNLLKEFQAKKSEKTLQSRPDSAPISRDYNHRSEAPRAPSPPRAEPGREAFREGMQRRPVETHPRATETHPRATETHPRTMETHPRTMETHPRTMETHPRMMETHPRTMETHPRTMETHPRTMETHPRMMETHQRTTETHQRPSQDPRGWEEEEQGGPPAKRFQEHRRPVHPDSNVSRRQRYDGVFGGVAQHRVPRAPHPEEPVLHHDRFQDPGDHYDYMPSASPPYHREQGYRMHGGPQHSSSLDKITSTLLELVARK